MEKLWSPWRSQYIESFNSGKKKSNCIFCDASNQKTEDDDSLIIDKDKLTFTVLNLYPYNNGHLMVIPHRHLNDITLLTPDENLEIMLKIQQAIKALKSVYNPDGFNLGTNLGKASGAGIDEHIHFHIVPRWNGDTNFMPVLGEVKVLSQDLLETKSKLISAIKKINLQNN